MFETLRLHGSTERSIVLQTHRGRDIKNVIDVDPDYYHLQRYQRLLRGRPGWRERKPATGGYNCVGHVLASRRTGVFDALEEQLQMIFQDDGYRVVDIMKEPLKQGDLVTYWKPGHPRPTFLHVGIIFEMKPGLTDQSPLLPWVLSKLDSTSGEVLHHYNDVTFIEGVQHVVEVWTDRPPQ